MSSHTDVNELRANKMDSMAKNYYRSAADNFVNEIDGSYFEESGFASMNAESIYASINESIVCDLLEHESDALIDNLCSAFWSVLDEPGSNFSTEGMVCFAREFEFQLKKSTKEKLKQKIQDYIMSRGETFAASDATAESGVNEDDEDEEDEYDEAADIDIEAIVATQMIAMARDHCRSVIDNYVDEVDEDCFEEHGFSTESTAEEIFNSLGPDGSNVWELLYGYADGLIDKLCKEFPEEEERGVICFARDFEDFEWKKSTITKLRQKIDLFLNETTKAKE